MILTKALKHAVGRDLCIGSCIIWLTNMERSGAYGPCLSFKEIEVIIDSQLSHELRK